MYELHYKCITRKHNANLLFTDTDSLVVYEDLIFFDPVNKKIIGKMKDGVKGKIISEFVGLKLKMYSLITVDGEEIKKAKGVNKNVVKNRRHKEFVDVLFNKYIFRHKMKQNSNQFFVLF